MREQRREYQEFTLVGVMIKHLEVVQRRIREILGSVDGSFWFAYWFGMNCRLNFAIAVYLGFSLDEN